MWALGEVGNPPPYMAYISSIFLTHILTHFKTDSPILCMHCNWKFMDFGAYNPTLVQQI